MVNFKCNKCGTCCSYVNEMINSFEAISQLIGEENAQFPYKVINKRCEHLLPNNLCAVYDHRPIVCDVARLAELIAEKTKQDVIGIKTYVFSEQRKICLSYEKFHSDEIV